MSIPPRISFYIAAASSLLLGGAFVWSENNSPGLSFGVSFFFIAGACAFFAAHRTEGDAVSSEARTAAIAAMVAVVGGIAYLAIFFGFWGLIGVPWWAAHLPLIAACSAASAAVWEMSCLEDHSDWRIYDLSETGVFVARFALYKADGRVQILSVRSSESWREEAHRGRLEQFFAPWHQARQYPDHAAMEA